MKIITALVFTLMLVFACVYADTNMKTYNGEKYHYTIQYPGDWRMYDRNDGVVVFKKMGISSAYPSSVNIQTLFSKKANGTYPDVKALMDDLQKNAMKEVDGVVFSDRKPITLIDSTGHKTSGEEMTMTFDEQGVHLKQWQIMLITDDDKIFQAWAYRAPQKYYDADLPLAKAMLGSWVIE